MLRVQGARLVTVSGGPMKGAAMATPRSLPYPLGVTLVEGGANVAVYSESANDVFFCAFDGEEETRTVLPNRTGFAWHGFVPDVTVGTRYGLRVDGPWEPENGLRHNVHKLLLDPHALAISGDYTFDQRLFGHDMTEPLQRDDTDSASAMPRCVVVDRSFDWGDDTAPRVPLEETIVYETHVKGFTKRMPGVPEEIQGTYAGLAHPKAIEHLVNLGITSVELLPVHQFVQDSTLADKGLANYWGYNTIGFFAPNGAYSSAGDEGGQVAEFKSLVKALHAAGLEVILDVVYNHTAEGNHMGPTLSFKGLDNSAYYRLVDEQKDAYFDTTGTGNSLNTMHPAALGLIMDSLRYWVQEMHIDGFRFDLATTLTRQGAEVGLRSAFLDLTLQDPVLQPVKLIAEPWDTAGYQVGDFPAEWSEWNGKFRDDVRDFWSGADSLLSTTSQRVLGSPDVYQPDRRSPLCSVNFVTAHDGFTLADLTAYNQKHNSANGEDNNDGESDNKSFNNGAEGPTEDPRVNEKRLRARKNLLGTLLLSTGVPMLLGGDEMGRTQGGNNNAYCQDNEISWYDWDAVDHDLLEFTQALTRLRREQPALRPPWYRYAPADGVTDAVVLKRSDDKEFSEGDWDNPDARTITFVLQHRGADSFALLLNSAENGVEFQVPEAPNGEWELAVSSDPEQQVTGEVTTLIVRDASFTLLRSRA